jgi:protein-tyrosine phosphatase
MTSKSLLPARNTNGQKIGLLVGGALALAGVALMIGRELNRRNRPQYPDPLSYLTEPEVDAEVIRHSDGRFEIHWKVQADMVRIYVGSNPEAIHLSAPIAAVQGQQQITLTDLDPDRVYFFELAFSGGDMDSKSLLVGERVLPLEGAANFRDLGGYRTHDGRYVRWGKVFRAGTLFHLTQRDRQKLQIIDLKFICDLRSQEEVSEEPNLFNDASGPGYLYLPMQTEDDMLARLRALILDKKKLPGVLLDIYTRILLDYNANVFGDFLKRIADETNLPAVVHCTAGKDRTGVAAALLLLALGVPEETVIADYTLSNRYYSVFYKVGERAIKPLRLIGVRADDLYPLLVANPATLKSALAHVYEKYGSVDNYLREAAGLDDDIISRLKANLLTS